MRSNEDRFPVLGSELRSFGPSVVKASLISERRDGRQCKFTEAASCLLRQQEHCSKFSIRFGRAARQGFFAYRMQDGSPPACRQPFFREPARPIDFTPWGKCVRDVVYCRRVSQALAFTRHASLQLPSPNVFEPHLNCACGEPELPDIP